ncbi:KH domain-containing protein [Candidatus Uhrbacteria bacterium]|nr:KH domain-containing protein [Candidatus Uhrbacteria bacterium]
MAKLVEEIVKAIVDHEEEVRVSQVVGEHSIILELHVHPDDVRKVIGKKAVNAAAIRWIVHAAGGKERKRYALEILA